MAKSSLKLIALSGTTGVNENLYLYEYGDEMIIVDCGIGFPESDMYGVDIVIPDFTYIVKNKNKLRGILVSHGHEDHLGALPFLLKEVQAPIHAAPLTASLIKDKLLDNGVDNFEIKEFDPDSDEPIEMGSFKAYAFRVAHSIPDSVGYAIDTPEGRVFHVAEHKFELNPSKFNKFDEDKAKRLAKDVLMLASDCIGANKEGFTPTEAQIEGEIEGIVKGAKGAVYFTTISSSIARMQMAINAAKATGRKVAFVGRTVDTKANLAEILNRIDFKGVVSSPQKVDKEPRAKRLYIAAGSYGQVGSAMYRLAMDEHKHQIIEKGDTVIFSSDPAPPGSKESVDYIVDSLFERGAEVFYYDLPEFFLHVSGHGSRGDIVKLFDLVNPKYYIPVGGTIRHMHAYENLLDQKNVSSDNVFKLKPGEIVEFSDGKARVSGKVESQEILVDGLGIGDVGNMVLSDRRALAQAGIVVVLIEIDKKSKNPVEAPILFNRGFVFERQDRDMLSKASKGLFDLLKKQDNKDRKTVKANAMKYLEQVFFDRIGRRPMILPVVAEV